MYPIFYDQKFNKRRLKKLIMGCFVKYGGPETLRLVENLKTKGFLYSTHAGLSLNIEDLTLSPSKPGLCQHVKTKFENIELRFQSGVFNFNVYLTLYLDLWNNTTNLIKDEVVVCFQAYDTLNPVYMMAFSGARGNISQVRQLVGCRGLMTDANNNVVTYGIGSNFREGLTVSEYVVSCSGARKGVVDTALRTATAGYLTRRLVDSVQHVVVRRLDCGSGLSVQFRSLTNPVYLGGNDISGRLLGRVLKQTLLDPSQRVLGRNNDEISARMLEQCTGLKACRVRSPVTCAFNRHVCRRCYGWNNASLNMVDMGSCVGILAGQSIGEPGTQLTMRTFHTGGVFTGETSHQLYTPVGGWVFLPVIPGQCVRSRTGVIGFMTKAEGHLYIVQGGSNARPSMSEGRFQQAMHGSRAEPENPEAKSYTEGDESAPVVYRFSFPPFSFLHLKHGENIACGQTLGTFFDSKGVLKLRRMYGRLLSPVSGMVKTVTCQTLWPETRRAFRTAQGCLTYARARQFLPWKTHIRDFALPRLNLDNTFLRNSVLYRRGNVLYEKRKHAYAQQVNLWVPRNGQPDKRLMMPESRRLERSDLMVPLLSGFSRDVKATHRGSRFMQDFNTAYLKGVLYKANFLYGADSNQSWFTLRPGKPFGFRDEPLNLHRRNVDRRKGTACLQQMRRRVLPRLLLTQQKPYHGQHKVNLHYGYIWVLSCDGTYLHHIDQDLPYAIHVHDLTAATATHSKLLAPPNDNLGTLATYKKTCAGMHFMVHTYKSRQNQSLKVNISQPKASLLFSTHLHRHLSLETTPRPCGQPKSSQRHLAYAQAFWGQRSSTENILNLWSQFCKTILKQEKTLRRRRFLSLPGHFQRRDGFLGCVSKRIFFRLARSVDSAFQRQRYAHPALHTSPSRTSALRQTWIRARGSSMVKTLKVKPKQSPRSLNRRPMPALSFGYASLPMALIVRVVHETWILFFLKQNAAVRLQKHKSNVAQGHAWQMPWCPRVQALHGHMSMVKQAGTQEVYAPNKLGLCCRQRQKQPYIRYDDKHQNTSTVWHWRPKWKWAFHNLAFESELKTAAFKGTYTFQNAFKAEAYPVWPGLSPRFQSQDVPFTHSGSNLGPMYDAYAGPWVASRSQGGLSPGWNSKQKAYAFFNMGLTRQETPRGPSFRNLAAAFSYQSSPNLTVEVRPAQNPVAFFLNQSYGCWVVVSKFDVHMHSDLASSFLQATCRSYDRMYPSQFGFGGFSTCHSKTYFPPAGGDKSGLWLSLGPISKAPNPAPPSKAYTVQRPVYSRVARAFKFQTRTARKATLSFWRGQMQTGAWKDVLGQTWLAWAVASLPLILGMGVGFNGQFISSAFGRYEPDMVASKTSLDRVKAKLTDLAFEQSFMGRVWKLTQKACAIKIHLRAKARRANHADFDARLKKEASREAFCPNLNAKGHQTNRLPLGMPLENNVHVCVMPPTKRTKKRLQANRLCQRLDILPCGNISWLQRQMELIYARDALKQPVSNSNIRFGEAANQKPSRSFFLRYEQCYPSNIYRQGKAYRLNAPFSQTHFWASKSLGSGRDDLLSSWTGPTSKFMAPTHAYVHLQAEPGRLCTFQARPSHPGSFQPSCQGWKLTKHGTKTDETRHGQALTLVLQGFYLPSKASEQQTKPGFWHVYRPNAKYGFTACGSRAWQTSATKQKQKEVVWISRDRPDTKTHGTQRGLKTRILTLKPKDIYRFNGSQWSTFALGTLFSQGQTLHGHPMPHSGCLIFVHRQGMLLRRGRSFLNHQKMHVLKHQNDFVTQGAEVVEYPYRQIPKAHLTTGVVKVEGLFEMRSQKTLNLALNVGLYRAYRGYSGFSNLPEFQNHIVLKMTLSAVHYVLNTVQRVLIGQGVTLSDKHIEIILKTMSSRVGVQRVGSSGFVSGDALHRSLAFGPLAPKALVYQPFIMGISGASYRAQGFLSPASFQETSRMLARGVMYQSYDFLYGLKEKVISGQHMDIGYDYLRRTWFQGRNLRFSGDDLYIWFASELWNPKPYVGEHENLAYDQKRRAFAMRSDLCTPGRHENHVKKDVFTKQKWTSAHFDRFKHLKKDVGLTVQLPWETPLDTPGPTKRRLQTKEPFKRPYRDIYQSFLMHFTSQALVNGLHTFQTSASEEAILFERYLTKRDNKSKHVKKRNATQKEHQT